ncbi:xanthine dehydrogenase accessory factor [Luteibacter rhizovicinus]|uniref:Xanthine dehydrogenase accessory factor n=1 Tax=Luteibacter rhizovicinus TaxID=242606 RepID=A0A4R3YM45_9GAMM|nr:XdhC family protein [Luteibacter rhizovicinus]TCV91893.1 xanthine dehydrogenase accessory factor [Luteibacter rhizovicinus]
MNVLRETDQTLDWPAWPEYALSDDLLPPLREWLADGQRIALATLVSVEGPSPRPLGSEMLVAGDGRVAGYVSGGCVEAAVAAEALLAMADGRPRLLDYGVGSPVLDIQLSCGGRIGIFVRELARPGEYSNLLTTARRERRPVTVLSHRTTGDWSIVDGEAEASLAQYARVHTPPLRVVAVGGDPVTLALARIAPMIGVEVALLRPHGPATPPHGVAPAAYDPRALEQALDAMALDEWTAVYSLSHDAETDHKVALHALRSRAFAVGVLGSRHKIESRLAQLKDDGIDDEALQRLHLPAGIPIGAQTPYGIAVSILAQLSQSDRARSSQ